MFDCHIGDFNVWFVQKNVKTVVLYAPASGEIMPITDVDDQMFSQKMMGDGYGVKPSSDDIVAPVSGKVVSIFPTKHALTMQTDDDIEVLIHLGIDTVELEGTPFNLVVEADQELAAGALIGTMNRELVSASGKSDEIIVVLTNMGSVKSFQDVAHKNVSQGEQIGQVMLK